MELQQRDWLRVFDFKGHKDISLCVKGKHHKSPLPTSTGVLARERLELVHTDICRKINVKSFGGAEYFLIFVDYKTRYMWVYFLNKRMKCSHILLNGKPW